MKYPFLKTVTEGPTESLVFTGESLKIYIPDKWLEEDCKFFEVYGNVIKCVGLFYFSADGKIYEMLLPLLFEFEFSDEETFSGKIKPELPSGNYHVFVLHNGDKFVKDTNHVKQVSDMELIFNDMICGGKIPQEFSYSESYEIMLNLLVGSDYNTGLGVSSAVLECLFGETYRDKNDATTPFRKAVNKPGTTLYDGKMVRLSRVPELQSSLSALVGEDMFTSLDALIVRNKQGVKDIESPLEKIMRI